jgi:hypothetical protein
LVGAFSIVVIGIQNDLTAALAAASLLILMAIVVGLFRPGYAFLEGKESARTRKQVLGLFGVAFVGIAIIAPKDGESSDSGPPDVRDSASSLQAPRKTDRWSKDLARAETALRDGKWERAKELVAGFPQEHARYSEAKTVADHAGFLLSAERMLNQDGKLDQAELEWAPDELRGERYLTMAKRAGALFIIEPSAGLKKNLMLGDFVFLVPEVRFYKTIGREGYASRADGVYLGVVIIQKNTGSRTVSIGPSNFTLADNAGNRFEFSDRAMASAEMSGMKVLDYAQAHPGVQSSGVIFFEVPDRATEYTLLVREPHGGALGKIRLK